MQECEWASTKLRVIREWGGGGVPRVLSLPGPDGSRGLRTGTASRHLRYLQAVKVEILKKHWCSRQLILSDQYNILCNLISTPPPLISVTRPHPLVMHWCSRWVAQWPPPLSSLTTPPRGRSSSTWAHTRSSHSLSSETSSSTTGTVQCTL